MIVFRHGNQYIEAGRGMLLPVDEETGINDNPLLIDGTVYYDRPEMWSPEIKAATCDALVAMRLLRDAVYTDEDGVRWFYERSHIVFNCRHPQTDCSVNGRDNMAENPLWVVFFLRQIAENPLLVRNNEELSSDELYGTVFGSHYVGAGDPVEHDADHGLWSSAELAVEIFQTKWFENNWLRYGG